jgi:thiamine biosynthesis lipoprotein
MSISSPEHHHDFALFGTHVRVAVDGTGGPGADGLPVALRVHARLRAVHRALTRFDKRSELSALNRRAGEEVVVSATLLRAVQASLYAAAISDGLVDPTLLPALEEAGYATSRAGLPPAPLTEALAAAPARCPAGAHPDSAWTRIRVDAARSTVSLPPGTRLDLGGSAKGMAVDLAAHALAASRTFAVDAGGDIRIGGTDAAPRTVRITDAFRGGVAHRLTVTTGAVATSGLHNRLWRSGCGFAHHLLDPARGIPAWTGVVQATALAPTALEAETLAKTALLRGPSGGRRVLARHGGALILDDGVLVLVAGAHPIADADAGVEADALAAEVTA